MTRPRLSDHALLRLLSRSGLPVEQIRETVEAALERSHDAARTLGDADHLIVIDGRAFVVRGNTVTTVVDSVSPGKLARLIARGGADA